MGACGTAFTHTHESIVVSKQARVTSASRCGVRGTSLFCSEQKSCSLQGSVRRAPYLNFDAQLLQPPNNGYIEGIVGEGYERLVKGEKEEDDGEFHALSSDYEMASYFKAMEPLAFAGGLGSRIARIDDNTPARRLLIERHRASKLQFPMHAGAKHGVRRYAKVSFKEHSQTITAMPSQSQLQHRCGTNPYFGFENTLQQ